jgi:uncharacterized protein (UPF0332 family)
MTFDWLSFFNLAEALAKGELTNQSDNSAAEGCYRSSVSRAYYFAFHRAYEFLRDRENDPLILWHYATYLQGAKSHRQASDMQKRSMEHWSGTDTDLKQKVEKLEVHWYVRKAFLDNSNKDRKRVFYTLESLRKLRNDADYDSARTVNLNHASDALDLAKKTREYLEELHSK